MSAERPLFSSIADVRRRIRLLSRDESLLQDGAPLGQVAKTLASNHRMSPATQIMAGSMPVRRSIWWAALCLLHSYESSLSLIEREMLVANASWTLEPRESWNGLVRHLFEKRPTVRPSFAALNVATLAAISNPTVRERGGWLATVSIADAVLQAFSDLSPESAHGLFLIDLGERVAEGELFGRNPAVT